MASNDEDNAQLAFKELIYPVDPKVEKILGAGQYLLLNKPNVDKLKVPISGEMLNRQDRFF